MKMKTTLSLVAAAVALLSQSAFAQQTRDQRKSEAASAVKAGETKAGETQPGAKPQADHVDNDPRPAQVRHRCRSQVRRDAEGWRRRARRCEAHAVQQDSRTAQGGNCRGSQGRRDAEGWRSTGGSEEISIAARIRR